MLKKIDNLNQFFQEVDVTLDRLVRKIQGILSLLESARDYRDHALSNSLAEAKMIAECCEEQCTCWYPKRKGKGKGEDVWWRLCRWQSQRISEVFISNCCLKVINNIVNELKLFLAPEQVNDKFSSLNGNKIHYLGKKDLNSKACKTENTHKDDINETNNLKKWKVYNTVPQQWMIIWRQRMQQYFWA